ncbi:YebC/PmpR family DNA-binding transcriptional regulator [Pseudoalteromonas sp. SR44-5]|jgi:YebC/PmpR family DNA-binding regulatory protein|uniref:Probable transcriptional regulatory protein FQP85_01725 n=2 Tax=Pseudoalteromonas TaxID=53246 RepID=A0ABY3FHN3_9GAMM|nr:MULTISPECIES: YebC/PmpR family DNA-binding transcriptional regulator [Pseudoalteromonas]MBB1291879.1 YebC/PmpR family DNA-binding transcriptional regulator [Pseudoalteromonas sp. SR41-4]MBB1301308.1 YebC/PmpR family DNA-binding transcriptional regulator [Pseudoalteromonas sp. SR44-8]MBB1308160.1 YebC/PmpR family DNA-binding transcriptional regulator [Pseudoalteromonas sp. SR41-8]MBB1333260.1 YebC/PmpR family DNA-binding transcriptional regulator [Pseudoalteromonas sp. SR41-6]MBB1342676.1 Ye|tara:strand:+ start:36769 stop:37482 length:714 start_codon:yes stop_codon:yes gene_type:complete
MGRAYQNKKDSMAKTAGAKTKVYSKYGKEIYICAKNGGIDPDGNLSLRRLIERAKKDQVPAHVIDRAIDKAKGGGGEDYSATRYEGYGPGNCMIIVDCLTDNNKRTFADVRVCFTKANAKIGAQNSVSHLFDHLAIFVFDGDDDEAVLEALMMADVDVTDVEVEAGKVTVFAPHTEYNNTRTALEEMGVTEFDEDLISFVPQVEAPIAGEDVEVMERFLAMLEDCDDVQNVYHNAQF